MSDLPVFTAARIVLRGDVVFQANLGGTVTTSGEPDVIDHAATSEAVARWLRGQELADILR